MLLHIVPPLAQLPFSLSSHLTSAAISRNNNPTLANPQASQPHVVLFHTHSEHGFLIKNHSPPFRIKKKSSSVASICTRLVHSMAKYSPLSLSLSPSRPTHLSSLPPNTILSVTGHFLGLHHQITLFMIETSEKSEEQINKLVELAGLSRRRGMRERP